MSAHIKHYWRCRCHKALCYVRHETPDGERSWFCPVSNFELKFNNRYLSFLDTQDEYFIDAGLDFQRGCQND